MDELAAKRISIPYFHAANTAAALYLPPQSHLDLVRIGLALYGMYPDERRPPLPLKSALALKTKVAFVKRVPPGSAISYDSAYVTWKETSIAVLPIGYGDGLTRGLSNQGRVLLNGRYCPIVGKVTMDHTMVDVGDLKVEIGDEVILIGSDGKREITADEWARLMGTINYEITSRLSNRVERVYL